MLDSHTTRRSVIQSLALLSGASLARAATVLQASQQGAPQVPMPGEGPLTPTRDLPTDPKSTVLKQYTHEQIATLLRPLLKTGEPALFQFAVDVYEQCILGKLRTPEAPLKHTWLIPGGHYFAQWLWDTQFVVDLLALLPGQEQNLRDIYQNYWDSMDRWNGDNLDYAHGMIANYIAPDSGVPTRTGRTWRTFPAYSQAPLVAWGMERAFLRNGDLTMVKTGLPYLEQFHEWYWRERDVTGTGMIGVGAYSGITQHARWETYDHEVDLDGLKMTVHPTRKGPGEGPWYGDILIPANTAYLLLSEESLARMAIAAKDNQLADRCHARLEKGISSMRKNMWDEESGCFLSVQRDTLEKIHNPTIGGFMPLMAKVPTTAQAARMAQVLATPAWTTPLPIPTVASNDPAFASGTFWRGDVWPATVYQVTTGLAIYDYRALAADIVDKNIDNAMKVGINERYDSLTGKPVGLSGLGMSASLLTMALDGLSAKHKISAVKKGKG